MSDEFEVRGAHEAAVEHHAGHGEPLAQRIALFSAILATLGAVVSLLGGHTENDALYYKNEAVLLKARASDVWSYYQAEEIKRHIYEVSAGDTPSAAMTKRIAGYAAKSGQLRIKAEGLDRQSDAADEESRHAMRPHLKLAVSMTFLQIAIALASISALTRKRWLFAGAGIAAGFGVVLATVAWT